MEEKAASASSPFIIHNSYFILSPMAFLNDNYFKLRAGYLFPEIARRVNSFCETHPEAARRIIRCGIGDVTEPLPAACIEALHKAVDEMAHRETFHGYGPEQGYEFLRHAIAKGDYRDRGIEVADDEIFVSDGSKCDCGNILDIFGSENQIAVMDPVYPVYVDTNVMAGHTGPANEFGAFDGLMYLPCTPANGFVPEIPVGKVDIIYLCYPNNPTGATATREQLSAWVEYARLHESILLYDAAYEAYISDPAIPHSIFEIPGARECAIEFRSFSKNGGFTGLRCAFTVVPKVPDGPRAQRRAPPRAPALAAPHEHQVQRRQLPRPARGRGHLQRRRQDPGGGLISHYMGNARILREACAAIGLDVFGGVNAPYIWVNTPPGGRKLGHVRSHARGGEYRRHPRRRVRFERRRFFPHLSLQ